MSHVRGSNRLRCLRFLQKRVDRLVVNTMEEVLELRERLIHEGRQLDLGSRTLLREILARPAQALETQEVEILLLEQTVFSLHQGSGDGEGVHLVRLDIPDVSLPRIRGQDRIEDTEPVPLCDEEFDKVIPIVSR